MNIMKYIYLVRAETKKEFIYIKHYIIENITRTVNFFLLFMVVFFATAYFRGGGKIDLSSNIAGFQLIGYSFWIVAISCLDVFTVAVKEDAEIGVLESMALSHYGLISIFMSRTISRLTIDFLVVSSITALVLAITPVKINLYGFPLALLVLVVTILGLYGVGLTLAGIALLIKRVGSIQSLCNYFFLVAGGVFVPVSILPKPLAAAIYYLPLTIGVELARKALLGKIDNSFFAKLAYLIALSLVYYFLGVCFFKYFEKIAKKRGALAGY